MKDEQKISLEQFERVIERDGDSVHTFRNGNFALIGADWSVKQLLEEAKKYENTLELTGDIARGMGHGVAFRDEHGFVFVRTNENKLKELDLALETPKGSVPSIEESWEEKFNGQYTSMGYGEKWRPGMEMTPSMIKSFITTLLTSKENEMLERLEKMTNDSYITCGNPDCIVEKAVIEDAQTIIKDVMKG